MVAGGSTPGSRLPIGSASPIGAPRRRGPSQHRWDPNTLQFNLKYTFYWQIEQKWEKVNLGKIVIFELQLKGK